MKVLIQIGHPAHVHFFKNIIWSLKKDGHNVHIIARKKDVTLQLLEKYGFEYSPINFFSKSRIGKLIDLIKTDFLLYKIAKEYKPDIMIAIGLPSITHVGKLLRIPSIYITDTEDATLANNLAKPFASVICTPSSFKLDFGKNHIRFKGFKELASLHPNWFKPNPAILQEIGLEETDPFIIVRFISWNAAHDIGQYGVRDKIGLIKTLENYGRVILTIEGDPPIELKPYLVKISPEKIHTLLSYATLYVGEGGTMATEAAILGTPSIFVSSFAGTMGNFIKLEKTYDLLNSFADSNAALDKVIEILQNNKSKESWKSKRELLLKDNIDVTAFMIWFIENYPKSFEKMKNKAVL